MYKMEEIQVKETEPYVWEVPKTGKMLVPGRIYADKKIIQHLLDDVKQGKEWNALKQIVNVAHLPGIQKASLAMSDVHPGYGFCIGGVGAFDIETGIISVAGVGFDINCGVRTIKTNLKKENIEKNKKELAEKLFEKIPAGLGSTGKIKLTKEEIDEVLIKGAKYSLEQGYGLKEDLEFIEENGCIKGAKPENVSDLAKSIGIELNEKNEIIIDKEAKTNVKGVFACGDVVDTSFKQAITGVAEGVTAAYSAYNYINENKSICYCDDEK